MLAVPNEQQLYKSYNYTDIFLLTLVWNIGVIGMAIFAAFLLLALVSKYLKARRQAVVAR